VRIDEHLVLECSPGRALFHDVVGTLAKHVSEQDRASVMPSCPSSVIDTRAGHGPSIIGRVPARYRLMASIGASTVQQHVRCRLSRKTEPSKIDAVLRERQSAG
jgi:hypothetical protein